MRGAPEVETLWQPSAERALTSQAPSRHLTEFVRIPGHQTRPLQGAQQLLAGLVQGAREFFSLQQTRRRYHVRQCHQARVAGSCGEKGPEWV